MARKCGLGRRKNTKSLAGASRDGRQHGAAPPQEVPAPARKPTPARASAREARAPSRSGTEALDAAPRLPYLKFCIGSSAEAYLERELEEKLFSAFLKRILRQYFYFICACTKKNLCVAMNVLL